MKRIEANIINPQGSDGFTLNPSTEKNISATLIKKLCHAAEISMAELVRRRNELHPTDKTTPQNLSNKLSRDSLKLAEFIELANCAGFNLVFEEIRQDKTPETTNNSTPRKKEVAIEIIPKTFDELLEENFCEMPTINFESAIIAGEQCYEAANWIGEQLYDDISKSQELLLFTKASKNFMVKIRPIPIKG